uniref:Uncharacterized protein n=1 Tax=Anguilla anguilla TaxID=7936 RepID=A0A0E9TB59_ANGAN
MLHMSAKMCVCVCVLYTVYTVYLYN